MDILEESISESVPSIVFCQFRTEMDMVAAQAGEMGASVWSIRGGMSSAQVGAAVSEAREAANGGGAGLNLQFCRRILFLSQHWNPAVVHQAVGRAVRIGQGAIVDIHCFRIVDEALDNIDLRMAVLHGVKIDSARGICSSLFEGFRVLEEQKIQPVLPRATASLDLNLEFSEDPV